MHAFDFLTQTRPRFAIRHLLLTTLRRTEEKFRRTQVVRRDRGKASFTRQRPLQLDQLVGLHRNRLIQFKRVPTRIERHPIAHHRLPADRQQRTRTRVALETILARLGGLDPARPFGDIQLGDLLLSRFINRLLVLKHRVLIDIDARYRHIHIRRLARL